jgi:choice-of-anchor B domain-containing protein
MSRSPLSLIGIGQIALLMVMAAPVAMPHDDDPKILDKQPPFAGSGFRLADVRHPGAGLSAPSLQGSSQGNRGHLRTSGRDAQGNALAVLGPDTSFAPPITFSASSVQLMSWVTLPEFAPATKSGNDCWGYVSGSGREYALMGTSHGTGFVEVTQPDAAQIITFEPGPLSLWRDIKTYQTYAYAVSEGGGGIQVFDLSQIDSGVVTHVTDVTAGGSTTASHNVVIDEVSGFLYRVGGSSHGLRIYDLANPAAPNFVGSWDNRYIHDAQVVTYTSGPNSGKQIAFCASGDFADPGLDILDITNKGNIQLLDHFFYPNAVYSHQVWLSEDRNFLYLNDELDESGFGIPTTTFVIDVSNLNSPSLAGSFDNGLSAVGHNVYTHDGLLYEANYRSGLRVFDIATNATNPAEIAWFDVYPQDDTDSFNGLWNVYPFFPSGTVIGSDLEKGLFVWRLGAPTLALTPTQALPDTLDPDGFSFGVTISEDSPGDLASGSARLHYNVGQGWTSVPLVAQGGLSFQAQLPAMPCGLEVPYYVSAQSTDGITWTEPSLAAGLVWRGQAALDRPLALAHDMETDQGWTGGVAGDDATTGIWTRGNPLGTLAQTGDDHTPGGSDCWFTGQGPSGGGLGDNDVDDGTTTLMSPVFDLSNLSEPNISYWRWYVNEAAGAPAADDSFAIDISNDSGSNWTSVELLAPQLVEQAGGWIQSVFRVADYVKPTATVQLRFLARDLNNGSIVEAALDDFQILEAICPDCNSNGASNGMEILAGAYDHDSNGIPDVCELPDSKTGRLKSSGAIPTPSTPGAGPPPAISTPNVVLSAVIPGISLSLGGEQMLRLDAGREHAGKPYLLLGSVSGTAPGISLPGLVVPLHLDAYTHFGLVSPNTPPLAHSQGLLDGDGRAAATFSLPPGTDPGLAGLTIHHAFLVFDDALAPGDVLRVSNPWSVSLLP